MSYSASLENNELLCPTWHFHCRCPATEPYQRNVNKDGNFQGSSHCSRQMTIPSTGLHFQKAYTHSGTSCPQCVYQIWWCISPGFAQPRRYQVKFGSNMKVLRWHSKLFYFLRHFSRYYRAKTLKIVNCHGWVNSGDIWHHIALVLVH